LQLLHSNGQKAGIYWTPFVYWGTASQGSNSFMTGSGTYKWSSAYLRTPNGELQSSKRYRSRSDAFRFQADDAYYLNFFKTRGFDFFEIGFLTHGALEGVISTRTS